MTKINWYPGHMVKTKRKIKEYSQLVDVVFELIDARIPYSSKIEDIENIIDKPKILILTKYDLCDQNETKKWIKHYQKKYHVIAFDLMKDNLNLLYDEVELVTKDKVAAKAKKGIKTNKIKAMIIGIPNVGKSTLINRLVGKKATKVGNKPGVTTSLSWIRTNQKIELLDTPGILWPNLEDQTVAYNLASFNAIKETTLPLFDVATYIIENLKKLYPTVLKERYNLINLESVEKIMSEIGKKRGCLLKGGEIDFEKVALLVINDLKQGLIKKITFDQIGDIDVY